MTRILIAIEIIGLIALFVLVGIASIVWKSGADWMLIPWVISGVISYIGGLAYLSIGRIILKAYDRTEFEKYFSPFIYGSLFTSGFICIFIAAYYVNKYS